MQSTLKYLSSLILCMLLFQTQAQKTKPIPDIIKAPLFNGVFIQVDAASAVNSFFSKGETYSFEGAAQADFRHKLFPTIELGTAGANKLTSDNIGFKTNGLFGRIGVDLNVLNPKKDQKPTTNLFLVGLRLGMTSFHYDVTNATITDNYWGGSQSIPYNAISATKIWYEIVAGIHVEVFKNTFMGWTIRSKSLISQDAVGAISPWYIPGYGINNGSNFTINYTIGYKFHLPVRNKSLNGVKKSEKLNKQ